MRASGNREVALDGIRRFQWQDGSQTRRTGIRSSRKYQIAQVAVLPARPPERMVLRLVYVPAQRPEAPIAPGLERQAWLRRRAVDR